MVLIKTDFPQPDSPAIAWILPFEKSVLINNPFIALTKGLYHIIYFLSLY